MNRKGKIIVILNMVRVFLNIITDVVDLPFFVPFVGHLLNVINLNDHNIF